MGQLSRTDRPHRGRPLGRPQAAQGFLHGHLDLHRLQGVRGGVQGVEPQPPRRQPGAARAPPTTTPARWEPAPGATSRSSSRTTNTSTQATRIRPGARRSRHAASVPPGSRGKGTGELDLATTPTARRHPDTPEFRWLMASDVCKHCTHAGCLDVCPTGALFRTEFGTVVVQDDVCNGCGTCVAGCPFGVIERRSDGTAGPTTGRANRATGEQARGRPTSVSRRSARCATTASSTTRRPPARKTCPTTSIKFGNHDDLVVQARERVHSLHAQGLTEARLYGANEHDGVGGTGSVFLLLDEPEVYGLPPDPRVCTADLMQMYKRAGIAGARHGRRGGVAFLERTRVTTLGVRQPPATGAGPRDGAAATAAVAGERHGHRGRRRPRDADGAGSRVHLVLRPSRGQAAAMGPRVAAYLFLGGVAGGIGLARRRRPS